MARLHAPMRLRFPTLTRSPLPIRRRRPMTSLPTPKQWVIKHQSDVEAAEMIERHIDFVDEHGRSVHLPTAFVRHYMRRDDGRLPTIVAVSTLPLVLADGQVLAKDKFDRLRGISFRIQPEVAATVPTP